MTHTYSIGKMLEIKDKNIKLEEKQQKSKRIKVRVRFSMAR
jgi:hypothetical protein